MNNGKDNPQSRGTIEDIESERSIQVFNMGDMKGS
jgi:hypothetical protein